MVLGCVTANRLPSQGPAPPKYIRGFCPFGALTLPLPQGNHATHARHCRGLSGGQMRAREGGCNAGPGSSRVVVWNSGKRT